MKRWIVVLILAGTCLAQVPMTGAGLGSPVSAITLTAAQVLFERAGNAGSNYSVAASTTTLTISSLTAGNVIAAIPFTGNAVTLNSAACTNCTCTVQAVTVSSGAVGKLHAATCTITSSGATSIAFTFSAAPGESSIKYAQVNCVGCAALGYDSSGSGTLAATSCTNGVKQNGATVTPTGTQDFIMRSMYMSTGNASTADAPYNTNFTKVDHSALTVSFGASSYIINSTSGTAAAWTPPTATCMELTLSLKGT